MEVRIGAGVAQFNFSSANRQRRPLDTKFTVSAQIHFSLCVVWWSEIEFEIDWMRPSTISHLFHFCWWCVCEKRKKGDEWICGVAGRPRRPINKKQLPNINAHHQYMKVASASFYFLAATALTTHLHCPHTNLTAKPHIGFLSHHLSRRRPRINLNSQIFLIKLLRIQNWTGWQWDVYLWLWLDCLFLCTRYL